MRRIALLSLTALLGGCEFNTWWNPPFTSGYNPNRPIAVSPNIRRAMGEGIAVTPLATEPGDIWPGPLPPPRSLQDLQRQAGMASGAARPTPGSPLNRGGSLRPGAGNPLLAPLPGGTTIPRPSGGASSGPASGTSTAPPGTPAAPVDRRIIVPNGNGTSTVIHPDGRIETIPTPPEPRR